MSEWSQGQLGDYITLKRGYDLRSAERNVSGKVPVISSSGPMTYHDEAKVEGPGVVTGRYGTVGSFFYVEGPYWPLNTTLYVQDFKGNHPQFIYFFLHTLNFGQFSDKTSIPGVNRNDLHRIKVTLPPLAEQRKIAAILAAWDEAIALVGQFIAALQTRKKGLMQRLLTGQVRFPEFEGEEWRDARLGELLDIQYGKSPKDIIKGEGKYCVYGTSGVTGHTDEVLCHSPAVLIGRKGTIDKPQLMKEPFWAIDTTYYGVPRDGSDVRWIYYVLSNTDLTQFNEASGVPSLSRNTLNAIKVVQPTVAEQQRIADLLEVSDEEITQFRQYATLLQSQKQGLMQRLLTGHIRVHPDEGHNDLAPPAPPSAQMPLPL